MRVRAFIWFLLLISIASVDIAFAQESNQRAVWQKDSNAPVGSERNPVRVSSGVMAGRLIHREMPQYPAVKNGDKVAGAQVMHAVISPEGKVERLEWVSGPQIFREPVMDAVRRWTYKPYLLDGRAVWVETTITMNVDFGGM